MILVTGSTGIVGTRLVFDLLMAGHEVRALHRVGSDKEFVRQVFRFYHPERAEALYAKIHWHEGDVLDVYALEQALRGVDMVYHTAALVSYAPGDAAAMMAINRDGTANVVNIALEAGVRKFCHISSVAAIGKPLEGAANENTPWSKRTSRSVYGLSKYLSEREVWRGAAEGMPCIIVNPSVILGPAKAQQSSGVLMDLLSKGVPYYPQGAAGIVDVRDVSAISIALMDSDLSNERYLVSARTVPYKHLLDRAAHIYGNKPPRLAVKPWMLQMAWPLAALWAGMQGAKPTLTRETTRNASLSLQYDTGKVQQALGIAFIQPEESLAYYRAFFSVESA